MALGYRSIRECQANTSASDAQIWWLYDQEEPLGNREIRHQLANLLAKVHNRWRAQGEPVLTPDDFMFRSPEQALEREVEIEQGKKQSMIAGLKALALAQGPRPPRRRKKARR